MSSLRRIVLSVLALSLVVSMVVACGPRASKPQPTSNPPQEAVEPTLAPTITAEAATPGVEAEGGDRPAPSQGLHMNTPEYGMQAFLWWRPEVASRDLQAVRDAGFGWVKVGFGWRDIEGAGKGQFDWSRTDHIVEMANAEGINLVVRVDHQPVWTGGGFPLNGPPADLGDLADFFTALASRYKGRIRAYEVWNEPNLAREWGGRLPDPGEYAEMLRVCYRAIKAADPNAMVISAGLSPTGSWTDEARPDDWYLESLYVAMGSTSNGYFDALGVHAPGYKVPPETDPSVVAADPSLGGHRSFSFRRVEDLRAIMVNYGDSAKQMVVLEMGWTSDPRPDSPYFWHSVTEEQKAEYLVRAFRYARENWSPWMGLMVVIYIADPDWTPEHEQYWWAVTEPGYPTLITRPAYEALQAMPK